jgi:hypothetical protein
VVHAEEIGFFLPFPLAGGGVEEDGASGEGAAELREKADGADIGEVGVEEDGVHGGGVEERSGGGEVGLMEDAVGSGVEHGAHGLGEAGRTGDDEEGFHAAVRQLAVESRCGFHGAKLRGGERDGIGWAR